MQAHACTDGLGEGGRFGISLIYPYMTYDLSRIHLTSIASHDTVIDGLPARDEAESP